jgi:hypothetical protein
MTQCEYAAQAPLWNSFPEDTAVEQEKIGVVGVERIDIVQGVEQQVTDGTKVSLPRAGPGCAPRYPLIFS